MFKDFKWPEPEEEADEILIRNVRERGCHILGVAAERGDPPYAFSIGLALNYGQAEIVIFGMSPSKAAQIINIVRDDVAKGKKYVDGDVSSDILVNGKVCFIEVPLQLYDTYSGNGDLVLPQIARPFPCLQLVWPD
jgi:hypothetical protein